MGNPSIVAGKLTGLIVKGQGRRRRDFGWRDPAVVAGELADLIVKGQGRWRRDFGLRDPSIVAGQLLNGGGEGGGGWFGDFRARDPSIVTSELLELVVEGDLVEDGYERRWLGGCVRFGDFVTGWRGYAWCVGVSAGGGRWWWGAAMFHGQVKGVGR